MDQATHNKIVSFIWGIADDVLRDVFLALEKETEGLLGEIVKGGAK